MLSETKMQRFGDTSAFTVVCCMVSFAGCVVSTFPIQTPATTTRYTDVHSNKTGDFPPVCENRNLKYSMYIGMSPYSEEAYCNVSELNEKTEFGLQHATKSLTLYCHRAFSSTLWDGMFLKHWRGKDQVRGYKELRSIQIENCLLTSISSKAFEGLSSLRNLLIQNRYNNIPGNLCNNTIKEYFLEGTDTVEAICTRYMWFPPRIFWALTDLERLTLNALKLNNSIWEQIEWLRKLQDLSMQDNSISFIDKDIVSKLTHLKTLDLSNNYIQAISSDNTDPLSSTLETLIIHNNNMKTTAGWLTQSAFPSLKVLDISKNKVREKMINVAWPKTLEEVNVSRNDIEDLTIVMSDGFGKETSLKLLDASHNQITDISIVEESKSAQGVRVSLYLGDNPFHCDCNMVWLQKLITSQSSIITSSCVILDSDNLYCQSPFKNESRPMKDITPENFLCEYNVSCPERCKCYQNGMSSDVNIVDCKGNNITVISNEISDDCTALDLSGNAIVKLEPGSFDRLSQLGELLMNSSQIAKIEAGAFRNLTDLIKLDLAKNKLQTLENEMFEGLIRLEVLDLRFNEIKHIRKGSLQPLKALKQLNLRNNQLKTISKSEFQTLSQIQSLKLAQNPWSCACVYVELLKDFMINNSKHIDDVHEVTCESYDSETRKTMTHQLLVHKHEFCVDDAAAVNKTNDNVPMIVVITVMSVVIIGLIAFIFAFKHRKFLQIWCYVKFGRKCHHANGNDEDKEDRHYDAFVSYSGLDCDFIAQELVPRLEEPRNGKVGYKVCVHDRDFPAGGSTAETIIDVIGNSKRVIVVLSNNYLRSRWCRYEFEQANFQLVQEGKNRIILVLLEEVDPDLISTEIGNYMMTRTYLKYKDPKLWTKIQHAMPVAGTHRCAGNQNQDNNSDTVEFIEMDYI